MDTQNLKILLKQKMFHFGRYLMFVYYNAYSFCCLSIWQQIRGSAAQSVI